MNQASGQGQQGQQMTPEEARRAIEQARRQLQRSAAAADGRAASGRRRRPSKISRSARKSSTRSNGKSRTICRKRCATHRGRPATRISGGAVAIPDDQAEELAERKYDLQQELEALEEDIQRVAQQFREQTPEASDALNQALADLQSVQTGARLGYGGDAILRGAGAQVAATDAVTTSALRDLQRNTEEAQALANAEAVAGERTEPDPNAELRAEIQNLRRQLNEITQQQGQAQNGQGQPGQEAQQGQAGPARVKASSRARAARRPTPAATRPAARSAIATAVSAPAVPAISTTGAAAAFGIRVIAAFWDNNPGAIDDVRQQFNDASRELLTLGNELRQQGLSDEELRAVRELGDALRGSITGNPDLIEQEFQQLVNLAEQLELKLAATDETAERAAVRAQAPTQVAPGFEEAVAEYYRRLSRSDR